MATEAHTLTEVLFELYRRLNQREPDARVIEAIQQLREDNGLADDQQVPAWLPAALDAALGGREVSNVLFPEVGSDVGSFLLEVSEIVPGWEYDDQGELATMTFPALHVQLFLSREAADSEGSGCASYSVLRMPR